MKTFKKIWNVVSTVIVVAAVALAVLLGGARLLGMQVFTVLSGSMEPAYHVGSLIYVKSVEPEDVQVGDPITFVLNEQLTVATHRVVGITVDEDGTIRYQTKGDANNTVDGSLVNENNLLGEPVFTVPYLGYVAEFIQNPPGTYITIAAGAVLVLLLFLPELIEAFTEDDKSDKADKKKAAE